MEKTEQDRIRRAVSGAYGQAVSNPGGGCCGSDIAGAKVITELAGYTDEQIQSLPNDAVGASFGCGNPLAFSAVAPGDVVLDLGSGAGIDLLLAAKKVGASGRVIGVDMTDEMIARARENAGAAGLENVEVRKGIIEELPVEDASVDWVISNCVINLSPDKPRVFREIARVLRPSGRMLVSDIVARDLPDEVRRSMSLYASCLGGAISEEEYLDGLREVGLVDVEVRDRLIYEASQIEAFFAEDPIGADLGGACACGPLGSGAAKMLAMALAGSVWSAKIYARKP